MFVDNGILILVEQVLPLLLFNTTLPQKHSRVNWYPVYIYLKMEVNSGGSDCPTGVALATDDIPWLNFLPWYNIDGV